MICQLIAAAAVTLVAVQANAGCWHWTEHPEMAAPRAVICFQGKCEETTQLGTCASNPTGVAVGWANGWNWVERPKAPGDFSTVTREWQMPDGTILGGNAASCTPIDEDGCSRG